MLIEEVENLQEQKKDLLQTMSAYKQAEEYASDADEKLYDLEEEMNTRLAEISANTEAALNESQKERAEKTTKGLLNGESLVDVINKSATGGVIDDIKKGDWKSAAKDAALQVVSGGLYGIGKTFGLWDVGTSNQPADQWGLVHQGEIIVPRTFSDGIRSGELTLSRSSDNRQSASPIYVTVNVGGSVLSENQLVDSVYNGLVRGIESRRYAPLGA